MKTILAFDLGTGGTKASLFDAKGNNLCEQFYSVDTYFPPRGFHEQRPQDWFASVVHSAKALLASSAANPEDIVGIAVSGHSLAAAPVAADGTLLKEYTPIWTDTRGASQTQGFFEKINEVQWYLTTGNGFPAANYALFKIMWLKENEPEIYANTACFLGTKDYVNFRLTGVMATDHSYASGSGCYDLKAMRYQDDYIAAAGIDKRKLPPIAASSDIIGNLTREAAALTGLCEGIPVAAGGVDNACMALGAGCVEDGNAYMSLGTSSWIAVTSHEPIVNPNNRSYVFSHCIPGMFASATSIFSAGNSLRWVKNNLCKDLSARAEAEGADVYSLIDQEAALAPPGANKLLFNPSLAGGSPIEKSENIRGGFIGLTLGHTKNDVLRATLEGIALNLRMSLDVLQSITPISGDMLIVGGGGKSQIWRQIFADVFNMDILETNVGQDAGSLGAMACAAVGIGLWPSFDQVMAVHQRKGRIRPIAQNVQVYEKLLPLFRHVADVQADLGDLLSDLTL